MRDYSLHELNDDVFEELIVVLCREVLGLGTISFSKGRDGGRDGRFEGAAQKFPSEQKPWDGKFIIQAKHTDSPIASCSDPNFLENKSGILSKEIPKIKKLAKNGELDYYLLFTNRKLTAGADETFRKRVKNEAGVDDARIIGKEMLSQLITANPVVIRLVQLDQWRGPLRFDSKDIRDVIVAFQNFTKKEGRPPPFEGEARDMTVKNQKNRMSQRYFQLIRDQSQKHFAGIRQFLGNPINENFADMYYNSADELNNKLTIRREDYADFAEIFEHLYDEILLLEPKLKDKRRFINVFLHFMYWECDLGEK